MPKARKRFSWYKLIDTRIWVRPLLLFSRLPPSQFPVVPSFFLFFPSFFPFLSFLLSCSLSLSSLSCLHPLVLASLSHSLRPLPFLFLLPPVSHSFVFQYPHQLHPLFSPQPALTCPSRYHIPNRNAVFINRQKLHSPCRFVLSSLLLLHTKRPLVTRLPSTRFAPACSVNFCRVPVWCIVRVLLAVSLKKKSKKSKAKSNRSCSCLPTGLLLFLR